MSGLAQPLNNGFLVGIRSLSQFAENRQESGVVGGLGVGSAHAQQDEQKQE
jgi:hypothetical protein